jgi:PAS domain S-box-containing protein
MNSHKTTNTILGNLEEFLSISSIGIFLADISGRILKLNKPLLRLLKVIDEDQAQKIYNENIFNLFNDKENIKKSFSKLSQQDEAFIEVLSSVTSGKNVVNISLNAQKIYTENEPVIIGYITLLPEVTDPGRNKILPNPLLKQTEILNNIPYLAWIKNNEGKYISVNDAFANFFQKDQNQIIGKTDRELFQGPLADKQESYDLEVRKAGTKRLTEDRWKVDKEDFWVEIYTGPIIGESGDLEGIIGIARDISGRKAIEESILENEEHFRSLLQYSSDSITILDNEGFIVFESSLRNRISDFMIDELVGKPYQDIIHPEDVGIFNEILAELLKVPGTQIKREYRSLHKNKKWIYVESIFSNHLANPSIKGIVVNTRDISDRKMSDLKERVYHDNLIFLSNSALDLLGLSSRDDIFKYIGEKLHSFLEDAIVIVSSYSEDNRVFTTKQVVGLGKFHLKISELINADPIGIEYDLNRLPYNPENTGHITIFNSTMDDLNLGVVKTASINTALKILRVNKIYNITLARDNKLLGNISILTLNKTIIKFKHIIETFVHQVSVALHRSQLEYELVKAKTKAEESDMLKTAFLANMSHEIRTPMNGILGFAEMLNDENLSEGNRKKYVEIINNNGKMLMNLIDDIIDFAKIEAGQIKILNQEFSLNSLLTQVHSSFLSESLRKEKNLVKLRIRKAFSNEDCFIQTDPNRLRQVLTNLVGNAFKFTQDGYIEFGYKLPENGFIEFYVKDSGIGIPADKINLIFERFVQADYSRSRKYSGSGLGLAISRGFIELLGGEMWAESEVDVGSTFYFTIPFTPALTKTQEEIERSKPKSEYNWHNKCFLIAEDDKFSFKLLEGFLKKTNAEIVHAEDGIQAVDICRDNSRINLVLMDVQMPEMNGLEATKIIKQFRKTLPIIAQTANAIAEERQKCFEAGFDDFITKPINISELLSKIDKWLVPK